MSECLAISTIIPTCNRQEVLLRTLGSVAAAVVQPREIIINDASDDDRVSVPTIQGLLSEVRWHRAGERGAATQRNEAFAEATQPFVLFMDDDIRLEPGCLARLWWALQGNSTLGGVNAMITNQCYQRPGKLSRALFRFLRGQRAQSYAGQWLGSALNVLPEDREDLPEVVPVQWLNTTCTLYRREALPEPPFPSWFHGYSLSEDLWLSLEVQRRGWKVANARTARIFHDSQPGSHKSSQSKVIAMEVCNGWRIGREYSTLSRSRLTVNLVAVQFFKLIASLGRPSEWRKLFPRLWGNAVGWRQVLADSRDSAKPNAHPTR